MKTLMQLKMKLMYAAGRVYWQLFRPLTLGVRLLMIHDNQVMLVRHSYQRGWFLPGGGVKKKESLEDAARREAWEEVGAKLGELQLFGAYSNLNGYKSDHIVVYVCHELEIRGSSDHEITELRFFPLDKLPNDLTPGSRRRVEEYCSNARQNRLAIW